MPVTGEAMAGLWGKKTKDQDTGVSADFQRALMQEVMTTELLRIKALIATTALLDDYPLPPSTSSLPKR